MPAVGEMAPDFTALNDAGERITLSDYRGEWVVLYFYPKDNTPGCSKEACSLRDSFQALNDVNAVVLGISLDSPQSHRKFIEKYALPFTLVADTDAVVSTLYGVFGEKSLYGRTFLGIKRTTFLIDPHGIIRRVFTKVNVSRHGEEVLQAIDAVMHGG
jgi:peroxiredoxin Q/BCP